MGSSSQSVEVVSLTVESARLDIVPGMGGGLAGLWVADKPALRPWSGNTGDGPFALALNILAPFSGRIPGGFDWEGEHFRLEPNVASEKYPIHGDAFSRRWKVLALSDNVIDLELGNGAIGPWRYAAYMTYALAPHCLEIELKIRNLSPRIMPFGSGFHPWFPRDAETRLEFRAEGVWLEKDDHLPEGLAPVTIPRRWQYESLKPLPSGLVCNAFTGWEQTARIEQGAGAVSLELQASGPTDTAILYSPSKESDFFCFEPVTHPVDALNLPGRPGIRPLAKHEELKTSLRLDWKT